MDALRWAQEMNLYKLTDRMKLLPTHTHTQPKPTKCKFCLSEEGFPGKYNQLHKNPLLCFNTMHTEDNVDQLKVWSNTCSFLVFNLRLEPTQQQRHKSVLQDFFQLTAWTDTTAASLISSEGFVSIFQLELTQQQRHKSALKDFFSIYGLNRHNSKIHLISCRICTTTATTTSN